ncbi:MAG: DUF6516 family protein [Methanosarcinales archaeon]
MLRHEIVKSVTAIPDEIILNKIRVKFKQKTGFLDIYYSDDITNYSYHYQTTEGVYRWDKHPGHPDIGEMHEHDWNGNRIPSSINYESTFDVLEYIISKIMEI